MSVNDISQIGHQPFTVKLDRGQEVTMYWSMEIPVGIQALWQKGLGWIGVFQIGERIPYGRATDVLLNPFDYEAVKKTEMNSAANERYRRFHDDRNKLPSDHAAIIRRRMKSVR